MKTKILIVGAGVIGSALKSTLPPSYYDVQVLDPPKGLHVTDDFEPDAIFVCVPTPSNPDGTCDASIVLDTVRKYAEHPAHVVVRSTVPPSVVEDLIRIRYDVIIMPEFITEKNWLNDISHPPMTPIGCMSGACVSVVLDQLKYSTIDLTKARQCSPIEASALKYIANCFLATKVLFMHETEKWLTSTYGYQADWDVIKSILTMDERIGCSHLNSPGHHGYGFSGSCFPKDTLAFSKDASGNLKLLNSVVEINQQLRRNAHT